MSWVSRFQRKVFCLRKRLPSTRRVRLCPEVLEDRCTPTVTYYGGNILPHVEAQAVYLGSAWNATQTANLDSFLKTIVNGPFMEALTRAGYGVGDGSASAGYQDSISLAAGKTLTDADLQTEIQKLVTANKVAPVDANRLYVIFVQPNVIVDLGGGLTSQTGLLGYHGAFAGTGGQDIHYAVIAYPGGHTAQNQSIFNNADSRVIDDMTAVASHEVAESATDPNVDYKQLGWYDRWYGEVGDITQEYTMTLPNTPYYVQQISARNDQPLPILPTSTLTTAINFSTPTVSGKNATFTISVTSPSGTPTGTITLLENNQIVGTPDLTLKNGQVTTTLSLSPGTHNLTAVYSGDSRFLAAFSGTLTVTTTSPPPSTSGHGWFFIFQFDLAQPSVTLNSTVGTNLLGQNTVPVELTSSVFPRIQPQVVPLLLPLQAISASPVIAPAPRFESSSVIPLYSYGYQADEEEIEGDVTTMEMRDRHSAAYSILPGTGQSAATLAHSAEPREDGFLMADSSSPFAVAEAVDFAAASSDLQEAMPIAFNVLTAAGMAALMMGVDWRQPAEDWEEMVTRRKR